MAEETKTPAKASKPKAPQDRKPKAPTSERVEITVGEGDQKRTIPAFRVTVNGITVHVPEEVFRDVDFIELMAEAQAGNETPMLITRAMKMMLSPADYQRVKNSTRGPSGRADIEDLARFYQAMMGAISPS